MKKLPQIKYSPVPVPPNVLEDWTGVYEEFQKKDRWCQIQPVEIEVPILSRYESPEIQTLTLVKISSVKFENFKAEEKPKISKPVFQF